MQSRGTLEPEACFRNKLVHHEECDKCQNGDEYGLHANILAWRSITTWALWYTFHVRVFSMSRKVATPKKAVELDRSRAPVMLAVVLMLGIGVTTGAVMWGRSDAGQIDVSATIANSQYISDNAADGSQSPIGIAAQEFVDMPNGGLVASPEGEAPVPSSPVPDAAASSTSTTTEERADEETVGETPSESEEPSPSETPIDAIPAETTE